jgi:hypothetical protein
MAIYRGAGGPGDATTDAANEASVASNKATEAAASAAAALASEVAAAASASAASASASAASSSASSASSSASSASSSASSASSSASAASTSASNAATAETNAETAQAAAEAAQAAAEAAQSAAETAETNAETAETNAETAQAAAEAARDAALAALDNFDDRYLGQKSSDPTLDNDGNALVTGALYFNTTSGVMKVYDGSAWLAAYVSGDQALDDLTDVTITSLTTGQILKYNGTAWVNSSDYATSAQGALADSALQSGDNVSELTNDAGYLTSFTETDPVFTASPAAGITSTQVTNWDTAYGWGNHASAGYLTSETYTGTVTSVDMTVPTGLSVSGNPVTSSGTLAVTYAAGYAIPTTIKQSNWDDSYTFTSNFPSQTGNAGEYLTTDGSTLSWAPINVTPALDDLSDVTITTVANGQVLQYNGTAWVNAVVATGNTTSTGLWENSNTISSNYTIGTNYNAMSAGPVTVASGVTVTVPSGSRWVVI